MPLQLQKRKHQRTFSLQSNTFTFRSPKKRSGFLKCVLKRVSHKENCYSNCEGEWQLVKRSRRKLSSGWPFHLCTTFKTIIVHCKCMWRHFFMHKKYQVVCGVDAAKLMPVCLQLMKVEIVKEIHNQDHFNRIYFFYIELLAKTDIFYWVERDYLSQIPRQGRIQDFF